MNCKRRNFVQVMVVSVVLIGLLVAAWPGVAQGEKPPLDVEAQRFREQRTHEINGLENNHTPQDGLDRLDTSSASMWHITTLQPQAAHPSLAVDAANRPHLSYVSPAGLTYAFFDGTAWHYTTIESASFSAITATAIALDPAGQPRIAYTLNGLKYAYRDQTGWHIETIDNAADAVDLVIDAGGTPQVGYNNAGIKQAYRDNAGWHIATLGGPGQSIALRLGSPTYINLHMTYIVPSGINYFYHYAYSGWAGGYSFVSDSEVRYSSTATQYNGEGIRVAYVSGVSPSTLRHFYWDYDDIQHNEVVAGGTVTSAFGDVSLATLADRSFIAYYVTGTESLLKYSYMSINGWTSEPIDDLVNLSPSAVITPEVELELNAAGRASVVYNDSNGVLKYAVRMPPLAEWVNLAFSSYRDNNWEVYTARADGSSEARRTINPAYDSMPRFNRGASKIAFVSSRDGNYEVYSMNADGSGQSRLTATSANEYQPTWSPDGSKIAFYSYRDGNAEIYVMNADGTNQTRLTANSAWDGHPSWSPDGAQIVFASNRAGNDDLWVMNANGSNQHQLTAGLNAAYPAWSPDGSKIAFNDDWNNDGWLDVAITNADGTGLTHPLGSTPVNYDYLAPSWSPTSQNLAFAKIQWTFYAGNYYWVDAYLWSFDLQAGLAYQLTSSGLDWWPDWQTNDVVAPSSSVTTSPWSSTTTFPVQWYGKDTGNAGVASYDLQYRDGVNGAWTNWLVATNQTAATFTGQYGHTYYFRSRARDYASNLEAYPSSPDAMTTIYQHAATGQVLDNREQPIAVVNVQTNPATLNTSVSRHDGTYDLYLAAGGSYTLTTTRSSYGLLPPLLNVTVPSSNSLPALYLPPLDNQISDSHFESGDLSLWNSSGDLTPTITSTAHTGNYAALLGGNVPTDTVTVGPWHSAIEQTINVSPTIVSGTLSLLYRVEAADPLSDTLTAYVVGANDILTFTLPVTATDWTHAWFDLSSWTEPTATLKLDFALADTGRLAEVFIDEVTWGSAIRGSYTTLLPIMRR